MGAITFDDIDAEQPKRSGVVTFDDLEQPQREPDMAEKIAANPAVRFAIAASSPIRALGEMLPGSVGEYFRENTSRIEEMQKAGQQDQSWFEKHIGTGADIAGNVLSPASLKLMKAMPYFSGATGMARIPQLAKNVASGTSAGTIMGALTPLGDREDFAADKQAQVALSAGIGGAIPVVSEGARALGSGIANATGPFREAWRDSAARQWLNDLFATGDKQKIIEAIKQRQEIARGSPVTTADAIAAANVGKTDKFGSALVKIEDELDRMAGAPSDIAKSIKSVQQSARAAELEQLGMTPGLKRTEESIPSAIKARTETAARDYGKAYAERIKVDDELRALAKNPYFKDAQTEAAKVAKSAGVIDAEGNLAKGGLTQYLQFVKESLDKKLEVVGESALKRTERAQVAKLKNDLVNWIGSRNKPYDIARKEFERVSGGINRMQIGENLNKSLTSGLGAERPAALAKTVREMEDELGSRLTRSEGAAVNRVVSELERDAEKAALAKNVNVKDLFDIAEKGKGAVSVPPMITHPTTIARWLMHMTGNDADIKIARSLHETMKKNPDLFVKKYLAGVPKSQLPEMLSKLEKTAIVQSGQNEAFR